MGCVGWKSGAVLSVLFAYLGVRGLAQQVSYEHAAPQQLAGIAKDNSRHFGDDPDDGGPIATDLSASLDPAAVGKAMRKVGLAAGAVRGVLRPDMDVERALQRFYGGFGFAGGCEVSRCDGGDGEEV
jgi:hypothetical protein